MKVFGLTEPKDVIRGYVKILNNNIYIGRIKTYKLFLPKSC